MMNSSIKLKQTEDVIILKMKDEKINLRINEEVFTLKVSGQGPAGTPGAYPISCTKVRTDGLVDTYRLRMSDGSEFSFQVTNGRDGDKGDQGEKGEDGANAAVVIEEDEMLVITPSVDNYEGDYMVTPTSEEQTLSTSMKLVGDDITVKEIPYSETGNEQGGYTATIGG